MPSCDSRLTLLALEYVLEASSLVLTELFSEVLSSK